ncbi:hypothetical protein E4U55_001535 [Claviceps digitariae]|nr:hypothetical protein E4U55_001535 [Claviceps digitariae]
MIQPILDKYYEGDPYHVRSSAFVQAKGLVSNEKVPTRTTPSSGSGTAASSFEGYKRFAAQTLCSRSISPDLARRSLTPLSVNETRVPR